MKVISINNSIFFYEMVLTIYSNSMMYTNKSALCVHIYIYYPLYTHIILSNMSSDFGDYGVSNKVIPVL